MPTLPTDSHATDAQLSALVDARLDDDEARALQPHLAACAECAERLAELRVVSRMLAALPSLEPPRDFSLTTSMPRLVPLPDPPTITRLRQLYTATRVGAAALAAAFVFLSVTTLYVDSMPAPIVSRSREIGVTEVPGKATKDTAPAAAQAPPAARIAATAQAPASAAQSAPPTQNLSAPRSVPADGAEPSDLQTAATSVSPLRPTPVPTAAPTPTPVPVPVAAAAPRPQVNSGAPWRWAAIGCGILAVLSLLGALAVRHRLRLLVQHPLAE